MAHLAPPLALPRTSVLARRSRLPVRPAIAVAAFLAALLAARIHLADGTWLWNLDLPKIDYPLAVFFHQALLEGRLPLWNDRLGLGFPLYAEGQIGAFYPPNWLIFRLDPLAALDLARVTHLAFAGLGAGLLALRVAGSRSGAFVAAIVAVLSGGIVTKLEWTNVVEAYAWTPWILLPVARTPVPTRRGLVVAGTLWGIQALTGHPNTWLWTGLTAVLLVLARRRPRLADVARVAGLGALGVAVGAVQLVPTFILSTLSVRQHGLSLDDIFTNSATPFDPLLLAFSGAFVRTDSSGWNLATAWYPNSPFGLLEAGAYVGIPVLALAFIGARVRRARPFVWIALVMLAIAILGRFRPGWWADLPVLNGLRSPTRTYLFIDLALGILAACGLARIGRDARAPARALAVLVYATLAYIATLAIAVTLPQTFQGLLLDFSWRPNLPVVRVGAVRLDAIAALARFAPAALEIGIGVVFVSATLATGRRARVLARVAAIAVIPLLLFAPATNPLRPVRDFSFADSPLVQLLSAQNAHRVLVFDPPGWYAAMPDQLATAGVPDLRMFSSLDLAATDALPDEVRRSPDTLRALGVDVVVTYKDVCPGDQLEYFDDGADVCAQTDALRPPYRVPGALAHVSSVTPTSMWSPRDATLDVARIPAEGTTADVRAWSPTSATIAVRGDGPGWVFIDRAWWPAWRVTVDGTAVTPARALGGQLVPVPAGSHLVEETLFPAEAVAGLGTGLVALVVAFVWAGGIGRFRRRSHR